MIDYRQSLAMWHFGLTTVGLLLLVASFWGLSQALRGSQAKIALAHSALAWAQIASIPILVVAQMIFLVNFCWRS